MAEQKDKKKPLELQIECGVCLKSFTKLVAAKSNGEVRCPFCKSFTLALIEDCSQDPKRRILLQNDTDTDKKRKYRI